MKHILIAIILALIFILGMMLPAGAAPSIQGGYAYGADYNVGVSEQSKELKLATEEHALNENPYRKPAPTINTTVRYIIAQPITIWNSHAIQEELDNNLTVYLPDGDVVIGEPIVLSQPGNAIIGSPNTRFIRGDSFTNDFLIMNAPDQKVISVAFDSQNKPSTGMMKILGARAEARTLLFMNDKTTPVALKVRHNDATLDNITVRDVYRPGEANNTTSLLLGGNRGKATNIASINSGCVTIAGAYWMVDNFRLRIYAETPDNAHGGLYTDQGANDAVISNGLIERLGVRGHGGMELRGKDISVMNVISSGFQYAFEIMSLGGVTEGVRIIGGTAKNSDIGIYSHVQEGYQGEIGQVTLIGMQVHDNKLGKQFDSGNITEIGNTYWNNE